MFQMNGVSFYSYGSFQTNKMLISCMFNTILLVHVRLAESIAHSVSTNVKRFTRSADVMIYSAILI
jgi:hypothetical protein